MKIKLEETEKFKVIQVKHIMFRIILSHARELMLVLMNSLFIWKVALLQLEAGLQLKLEHMSILTIMLSTADNIKKLAF